MYLDAKYYTFAITKCCYVATLLCCGVMSFPDVYIRKRLTSVSCIC